RGFVNRASGGLAGHRLEVAAELFHGDARLLQVALAGGGQRRLNVRVRRDLLTPRAAIPFNILAELALLIRRNVIADAGLVLFNELVAFGHANLLSTGSEGFGLRSVC